MKSKLDSADLYTAVCSNDPLSQAAAYEALWPFLFQVALQLVYDQPNAADLAQDCAQNGLIRIHERVSDCREPRAFRAWARRIVYNIAVDALRRDKRLQPLSEDEGEGTSTTQLADNVPQPEDTAEIKSQLADLRSLLQQAPISGRSKRVVIGRYLDDVPDEVLAESESQLSAKDVRPSHIQVTRSKNIKKLRDWEQIQLFFDETA